LTKATGVAQSIFSIRLMILSATKMYPPPVFILKITTLAFCRAASARAVSTASESTLLAKGPLMGIT
jgi:hypothetical protein